ncbi:MAG: hypothetical protein AAF543_08675, partial [Pseudomonadota bacterium]
NTETLAVRVYQFACDERMAEASTVALAIVAVSLLPVILLSRTNARAVRAAVIDGSMRSSHLIRCRLRPAGLIDHHRSQTGQIWWRRLAAGAGVS